MFSTHASEKIYKYVYGKYANDNFYIKITLLPLIKMYKNHEFPKVIY